LRTIKIALAPPPNRDLRNAGSGLRQVSNPSEILISQKDDNLTGVTIGATIEGNRPLLIEIQSLVSPASYGTPQRTSTGFDQKRLNMLLLFVEKRCGSGWAPRMCSLIWPAGSGGGPGDRSGHLLCILSSMEEIPISYKVCFAAEVGLGGELRAVNRIEQRISEAEKLGFQQILFQVQSEVAGI